MRVLVAGIVVCGLAGAAHADRADQLFKKGKKLLAEKRYPEACTAFEESDRLDPGIGTKLNVARCYQEWGKLATAWRWFSDAEQMAKEAKDDRAQKIHEIIEELDATVPRLTVKAPRDASTSDVVIKLDGIPFDVSALGIERRVDPGPHQIDYTVKGAKQSKVIPVERGGSSEVMLNLPKKSKTADKLKVDSSVGASEQSEQTRRLIGLGVSGGGVVAMGVAGVLTLRARSDYKHAISAHCRGVGDMCDAIGQTATQSARHRANIATVVTVSGLAMVGVGLFVYFTTPTTASHGAEHALYLAPSIGGDGTGVVLGGAF